VFALVFQHAQEDKHSCENWLQSETSPIEATKKYI